MEVSEDMNLLLYSNILARTLYHILRDLRGPGNLSALKLRTTKQNIVEKYMGHNNNYYD